MSQEQSNFETVKEMLLEHRGEDNQISSREINEVIQVDSVGSFPKTRALVRKVMEREKIPIASGSDGYYIIQTKEELENEIQSINDRIGNIAERRVLVRESALNWIDQIEDLDESEL